MKNSEYTVADPLNNMVCANQVGMRVVLALSVSAAALLGMGPLALAQIRLSPGNALDANTQGGSGGSNEPVPGYVPINGNDVVTGNVAGLKYFHGASPATIIGPNGAPITVNTSSVGTFSPYTFQGQQGSASFNSFARQSAGGITTSPTGANQSYYLPSSTVSTAQGALYSAPVNGGFDSAIAPRWSVSPTASGSQGRPSESSAIPLRQFGTGDASMMRQPIGQTMGTPLLGTGQSDLLLPNGIIPATGDKNSADAKKDKSAFKGMTPGADVSGAANDNGTKGVDANENPIKGPQDHSDGSRITGSPTGDNGTNGMITGQVGGSNTNGVSGNGNGANGTNFNSIANDARVSDTYSTLLDRLKKAQADAAAKEDAEGTRSKVINRVENGGTKENTKPGANDNNGNDTTNGRTNGTASDSNNAGSNGSNGSDAALKAGKNVEPLKSFGGASGKGTAFDQLMLDGESQLKARKYLDAASTYQSALISSPGNALALLGRAQAELGAGLYRSSVNDLKIVFSEKPELTGVRYALGDYLPVDRQNDLIADLKTLTTNGGTGAAASFLLSYLYYNTGRQQDAVAELQRWGNRPWKDAWQAKLLTAWGK